VPAWGRKKLWRDFPELDRPLPPEEVIELYRRGHAGARYSKAEVDAFKSAMMVPESPRAVASSGMAGSGAGKLVVPYVFALERYPGCWPGPAQTRGDCFPAGVMVRMADGTEKPVEEVRTGEKVKTHTGASRRVVSTLAKPFDGELVSVTAAGAGRVVAATPDHRFVVVSEGVLAGWQEAGRLSPNDLVLMPGSGPVVPVRAVSRRPFSGPVHCLGVELDHSFVANGYAVHNCVSHSTKNAALLTMCCDVAAGQPDEQSGKPEEFPEVSAEAVVNGVLSCESLYWHRGYNGDGWYCPAAAKVACQTSGLYLRQPYPDLGFDLTRYSGQMAGRWGAVPPPRDVTAVGAAHLIHQATLVRGFADLRDLLFHGYGVSSCGQEGYSDRRDDWGVSGRQGSWAHAMAVIGADDRGQTHGKYGSPLVLIVNSWASWNSGSRDVYGSAALVPADRRDRWAAAGLLGSTGNLLIPEGAFWTPWSHCSAREYYALSGAHGWPAKVLPPLDWGAL
jgi:hypothetical protein